MRCSLLSRIMIERASSGCWRGRSRILPAEAWQKLSIAWGTFFLLLAALNQYFAMTLPLDAWVKVKVFGGTALSVLFVFAQAFWLARYLPDEEPEKVKEN